MFLHQTNVLVYPSSITYDEAVLTMFLHQTNVLVYPSSITYDEAVRQVDYSSFKECNVSLPT